jgi:hypothetical protein
MKKLFFSAIALVAFSGVIDAKSIIWPKVDCAAVKSSTILYAKNQGFTDEEANTMGNAVFDKCVGCDLVN